MDNIIFESKEFFTVIDFSISHKVLLLRGTTVNEKNATWQNTDLLFGSTQFILLPTWFEGGIIVKKGISDKIINIYGMLRTLKANEYFEIINNNHSYYIESFNVEILTNNLDTAESSIDGKKFRNMDNYVKKEQIETYPYLIFGIEKQLRDYVKVNMDNWKTASENDKKDIIKIFVPNVFTIEDDTLDKLLSQMYLIE